VDGSLKGVATSFEQIFFLLASYSLTKMPTGQKLAVVGKDGFWDN